MKKEIIELRKRIFDNLKEKALSFESSVSAELINYRKDQEFFSKREFSKATIEELKKRVKETDAIYLGDFHTFDQNIRNVLRIIKVILNSKNKCIVALEMVDAQFQFYIDTYMDGHLTDLEFLESIDYHESWRFPWTHYKLIFDLAKENDIKIIGLNTKGNLIERDLFAANLISHTLKTQQNTQVLVLYGELHLTPNKIPKLVKDQNPQIESVIIHQNLDEVYWKLEQTNMGRKKTQVIEFDEDEFSIQLANNDQMAYVVSNRGTNGKNLQKVAFPYIGEKNTKSNRDYQLMEALNSESQMNYSSSVFEDEQ